MATDKQESILKQYLNFDSYCFMSADKAKMFIDMIFKLSAPSVLRKDLSLRINENILSFYRMPSHDLFLDESTINTLQDLEKQGVTIKDLNNIQPITNLVEPVIFTECVLSDKTVMLIDDKGKIAPSYFELLYRNKIYGVLDIIRAFSKEWRDRNEKE